MNEQIFQQHHQHHQYHQQLQLNAASNKGFSLRDSYDGKKTDLMVSSDNVPAAQVQQVSQQLSSQFGGDSQIRAHRVTKLQQLLHLSSQSRQLNNKNRRMRQNNQQNQEQHYSSYQSFQSQKTHIRQMQQQLEQDQSNSSKSRGQQKLLPFAAVQSQMVVTQEGSGQKRTNRLMNCLEKIPEKRQQNKQQLQLQHCQIYQEDQQSQRKEQLSYRYKSQPAYSVKYSRCPSVLLETSSRQQSSYQQIKENNDDQTTTFSRGGELVSGRFKQKKRRNISQHSFQPTDTNNSTATMLMIVDNCKSVRSSSRLSMEHHVAPRTQQVDLALEQNLRLNMMRQTMQDKIEGINKPSRTKAVVNHLRQSSCGHHASAMLQLQEGIDLQVGRGSIGSSYQHTTTLNTSAAITPVANTASVADAANIQKDDNLLPPINSTTKIYDEYQQLEVIRGDQTKPHHNFCHATMSEQHKQREQFNRPDPWVRPLGSKEAPIIEDHVQLSSKTSNNHQPAADTTGGHNYHHNNSMLSNVSRSKVTFVQPTTSQDAQFLSFSTAAALPLSKQSSKQTNKLMLPSTKTSRQSLLEVQKCQKEDGLAKVASSNVNRKQVAGLSQDNIRKQPESKLSVITIQKQQQQQPSPRFSTSRNNPKLLQSGTGLSKSQKSKKKSFAMVQYDQYGARTNAPQEEQVQAIVQHFRQRMIDGTWAIMAGPPKKREPHPRVAKECETLLQDSIGRYQSDLRGQAEKTAEERQRNKAQLYLGYYSEKTINLYQELIELQELLDKTKQIIVEQQTESSFFARASQPQAQQNHSQRVQDSSIQEITDKIKQVYNQLVAKGPDVPAQLQKFISVDQSIKNELPLHLPDVHREIKKIISTSATAQDHHMPSSIKLINEKEEEIQANYFKPYDNGQIVSYTDQACIQDRKLEIFRYEIGDGLVDALSRSIQNETMKTKTLTELTLDQNNLTDSQLAKILEALYIQCSKFRQACQTINISNNDFGSQSAQILLKFLVFQSPENIFNLRLSNLKINETDLGRLFDRLVRNEQHLIKLRLSGIFLSNFRQINIFADFLRQNDLLTDLDLSYTQLQVSQLIQIFEALPNSISLTDLSIAFNTINYSRAPDLVSKLFKLISNFLVKNNKLMHLDLSGCSFGEHIVAIAPAFAQSLTLQSIHLHANEIPEHARQELFDQLRIRHGVRQTLTQLQQHTNLTEESIEEMTSPRRMASIAPYSSTVANQTDVTDLNQKIAELKRQQMKMECIQFNGVGRRREVYDKLILIRIIGHQELNLFNRYNVLGWQVSPTDQCYICENWKYTLFFYDRRKYIKNKVNLTICMNLCISRTSYLTALQDGSWNTQTSDQVLISGEESHR